MSSLEIKSFLGIRNTNPARSIPDNALSDAVDVDINDAGDLLERLGSSLALALPVSSAYTTHEGLIYLITGGRLKRLGNDLGLTDLAASTATEFADKDEYLFTNDGLMVYGNQALSILITHPDPPLATIIAGDWPAGIYNFVATQTKGIMSHASPVTTINLPANSAIKFTAQALPGYTAQVWMTDAQGDAKTGGEVFYNIDDGSILPEIFLGADYFPGGYLIEWFDSAIYLAKAMPDHTVINYSFKYHYHLFSLPENYFIVPDTVHYMRATKDRLVLGCESGIYAYDGQSLDKVADYGCPEGRNIARMPDGNALLINSKRGVCQYPDFTNLTEKDVSLPAGGHCSTQIVHQRGMQQFVALHDEGQAFNKHY